MPPRHKVSFEVGGRRNSTDRVNYYTKLAALERTWWSASLKVAVSPVGSIERSKEGISRNRARVSFFATGGGLPRGFASTELGSPRTEMVESESALLIRRSFLLPLRSREDRRSVIIVFIKIYAGHKSPRRGCESDVKFLPVEVNDASFHEL